MTISNAGPSGTNGKSWRRITWKTKALQYAPGRLHIVRSDHDFLAVNNPHFRILVSPVGCPLVPPITKNKNWRPRQDLNLQPAV